MNVCILCHYNTFKVHLVYSLFLNNIVVLLLINNKYFLLLMWVLVLQWFWLIRAETKLHAGTSVAVFHSTVRQPHLNSVPAWTTSSPPGCGFPLSLFTPTRGRFRTSAKTVGNSCAKRNLWEYSSFVLQGLMGSVFFYFYFNALIL